MEHRHGSGPMHYACESEQGTCFELYAASGSQPRSAPVRFGFVVDDLERAVSSGVEVIQKAKEKGVDGA